MNDLITYLWRAYDYQPPFGNRQDIRVDDYVQKDGNGTFCGITVTVEDHSEGFSMGLQPMPLDDELRDELHQLDTDIVDFELGTSVVIKLSPHEVDTVRYLAERIRQLTAHNQELPLPNWKHICRRTADSLDKFAGILAGFNEFHETRQLEIAKEENEEQSALAEDAQL